MAIASKVSLNFIDVFAGAGGLSCGLEMAGHKCLLGVDYDQHAMNTFAKNHKHAETYCGDIKKLTTKKILELTNSEKIDVVVGGPPCQGFSTAGAGNPEDIRNHLFLQFVRIVKATKPLFIVLENVTGLMAKKNEGTLKSIFNSFKRLGYTMDIQILSSHNYGTPEKRRRTILMGTRINEAPIYPPFSHEDLGLGKTKKTVTVGDAFNQLADRHGEIHNHDLKAAKLKNKIDERRLARIPEGKGVRYEKDEKAYFTKSLKLDVDWVNLTENRFRQCKYQRLDRQRPGPTIMTNRHSYYHPIENRYITAREAAKIQSFPNSFIFTGPISAQWRQIGNAVPPLLGKAIGFSLTKMFLEAKTNKFVNKKAKKPAQDSIEHLRGKAFVYRKNNAPESRV